NYDSRRTAFLNTNGWEVVRFWTKYLAKQFRVAKSQVIIEKGELGRHKQVKILNPQAIPTEVAALTEQD
ncbi:DUF559 domain-containing protein, partial [Escherichia coli]|nr:DUF559 domain-containing protein [Escherichia coli]